MGIQFQNVDYICIYGINHETVMSSPIRDRPSHSFQQVVYRLNFLSTVFGCPDPDPPSHGLMKRDGDRAVLSCQEPDTSTWEIICEDGDWNGYYGNCSLGKDFG